MDKSDIIKGINAVSQLYILYVEVSDAYLQIKKDYRKIGVEFTHEKDFRNIIIELDDFLRKSIIYVTFAPQVYEAVQKRYKELLEDTLDELGKRLELNQNGVVEGMALENRVVLH